MVYDDRQQFTNECNKKHYKQMDKILDRVTEVGWDGLSDEDKEFLADGNNNYYDTNNPN